jgi:hypothetical protein
MIWIAVFPTLTVLNLTLKPWLVQMGPILRTFVLATIAVPIVIYGLMPRLHRARTRLLTRFASPVPPGFRLGPRRDPRAPRASWTRTWPRRGCPQTQRAWASTHPPIHPQIDSRNLSKVTWCGDAQSHKRCRVLRSRP